METFITYGHPLGICEGGRKEAGGPMFDSLFGEVLDIVESWTPEREYLTENGYRDDLYDYLREELNKGSAFDFAPRKRIKLKKEDGRSLADIAVHDDIAIELKKDLRSRSEIDRLSGQVRRFEDNYSDVIIVLCGNFSEEAFDEVMGLVKTSNPLFGSHGNIEVVRKDGKKPRRDFGFNWRF